MSVPAVRLERGLVVRLRRPGEDDGCVGRVVMASQGAGPLQSVMVLFWKPEVVRLGDGLAITAALALTVDYDAETVTSLDGAEWEVDVAAGPPPAEGEADVRIS